MALKKSRQEQFGFIATQSLGILLFFYKYLSYKDFVFFFLVQAVQS